MLLLSFSHSDVTCSDDQNNCPNNSYCYIYSETGQPYCAQSCELNNGGCGTDQCEMVTVECITAPCPPVVQCSPASEYNGKFWFQNQQKVIIIVVNVSLAIFEFEPLMLKI